MMNCSATRNGLIALAWSWSVISCPLSNALAGEPGSLVKATIDGKRFTGKLLASDGRSFVLLQADGKALVLQHTKAKEFAKINASFRPLKTDVLRDRMLQLIPKGYEVTNTGNYVVIHPTGTANQWAIPFEKLLGRFTGYFDVRGFDLNQPEFPLVVVVYATRAEFLRAAERRGVNDPANVAGFYSPLTNQVITFVQTTGMDQQWDSNHLTLVHEALHQYAFNSGIHNRWAPTPKWASEGLAVMFEARGVYDSRTYTRQADRIHRVFCDRMKKLAKGQDFKGFIGQIVESDRLFDQDVEFAYAVSWATMFYLAEHRPRDLSAYLKSIAQLPNFSDYNSAARLQDFARHFGSDFKMLESRIIRFIDEL